MTVCRCYTLSPARTAVVTGIGCTAKVSQNIRLEDCVVKLRLRDNEGINDAVKRFRKLVEHAGIKKEMRRREFYEKPSETRRRARRRAERRSRIQRMVGGGTTGGPAPASKPER
jgi:small subunit ribosomal protein S21